jgi:subtilisin-like proprotein convertase family protein
MTPFLSLQKFSIRMKNFLTTSLALLLAVMATGQSAPNFFKQVSYGEIFLPENAETVTMPSEYLTFSLDFSAMRNHLRNAPAEGSAQAKAGVLQVQLPLPDGSMETFKIWESSVMHPELAAKFPMIKTYAGRGITDPSQTIRLGYGPDGFHAVIPGKNGGSIVVPYASQQTQYYLCFTKSNFIWEGLDVPPVRIKIEPMEGVNKDETPAKDHEINLRGGGDGDLAELRIYQFALACTGEYAVGHGGTMDLVMSSLVLATNTLNSVLERDMDMRLNLIPNNDLVVFLNPNSDPYNNSNMGGALLAQNENVLNQVLGLSNFDVGHLFTGSCTDVGGVVSGSVCSQGKARGVTCHFGSNVVGTTLSIAAHEMGHQFTGGHTFNNCPGQEGQFHSGSAYEPGSGSTILSYQGSCGQNNIPGPANIHYHGGTIEEFWTYTHNGGGNVCPTIVETSNHTPLVELPYEDGFYIPISTPFELNAIASDADGDPLTYCWEQINLGPNSTVGTPFGTAPTFRSYDPTTSPKRTFPRLPIILNNGSENVEVLPTYSRNLEFRCTVRDNNVDEGAGGVTWQDVSFEATNTAGPFLVNYPNTSDVVWKAGQQVEITWDVANTTNNLVKCHAVNIKLSKDGGLTYPYTLSSFTPNDGSETVFVPEVLTNTARIRVEASNNIFFDISNQNFQIEAADVPGYTLSVSPQLQQTCVPQNATVELSTGSVLGFDTPVEFEILSGLPTGVGVTFSSNPVAPGETTTLTLDMGFVAADGFFEVELRAIAGTDTTYRTLFFNVVYSDFSALKLESPTDGQSSLGLLPTFTWTDLPQADAYDFELASSPTFADSTIINKAFNLTAASYVPTVALVESKIYYWRVRPSNECGKADFTTAKAFQTRTVTCQTFQSNDIPKQISGVGLPVVDSKLPILQSGIISDLNVSKLKGNHDALADIKATLISPQGTEVVLFSQICGNVSQFDMALNDESPFDIQCPPLNGTSFKPQNPLATFIGENTLGEWTMRISVVDPIGAGGSFQNWSLQFCASTSPKGPLMVKNDTLYVKPLETRIIHNFELAAEDEDNTGNEIKFRIVDAVNSGFISKDGVQLGVNDQFTMTDIHQEKITYTNTDGNAVYDFFTFVVEDGTGGWTGTPRFNIVIDENAVTGTDERDFANSIFLFPNPASNLLNVTFRQPLAGESTLFIADLQGRLVSQQKVDAAQQNLKLDLGQFADGIYFLTVRTAEGVFAKKFVVQH